MDSVRKFLTKLYRGIGSPMALKHQLLLDNGEWDAIQSSSLRNPSSYIDAESYFKDALVVEITRKLRLPTDLDRCRENAVATFWASEAQCAATNARLARYVNNGPFGPVDMRVMSFIDSWRKKVSVVLGKAPWILEPAFSGGSTLSDKGLLTTIPDKMSSYRTSYQTSVDLEFYNNRDTVLLRDTHCVVRGNRFFTVPKDSFKDRGCCVEASGPVMLQLAVGKVMKERLRKRYKIDIATEAQDWHRHLAREASHTGHLATVDLSNASDTVAKALVKLVLPSDWYWLLDSLRAKTTDLDGSTVYLQKFSSMGNGFTFELETILFRTLCEALGCHDSQTSVFGDDIIIPVERSDDLMAALSMFGFTPNLKKSFCEGPFRESCGGDFFAGKPVRAHYLKELPDEPQKWLALANGLRRVDPGLRWTNAAWRYAIDQLPVGWRVYGPSHLGDQCINLPEAEPTLRQHRSRSKLAPTSADLLPFWRIKRPITRKFSLEAYWKADVAIAAAVLGVGTHVSPRDSVTGYTDGWVLAWGVDS